MAARYWVGGTAAWDATAGTKWALTDGGAGGQAVPTAGDDVFFTALSGAVTVTIATTINALSMNFTGFTGTITGSNGGNIYGNLTLVASVNWTNTGQWFFGGTTGGTIISAGKNLSGANIAPTAPATFTLGDAMLLSGGSGAGRLTVTQGGFNTAGYNLTATDFQSSNSSVRTINLGSSTVTLSSTGTTFNTSTNTNLTFNAGTSSIVLTGAAAGLFGGATSLTGLTFYNVSATGTAIGTITIGGINTFNNVAITGSATVGVRDVAFNSRQTINGTLSTTGTAGNRRVWFQSNTYGIAQTLTINSAPSLTDADFRDIYVIGTAAPISGTRIGDLRGIRGITASTPKTVYWNLAAGGNWSANAWAATSGGAVSTDNFPLAQDTAVIENTGLNTSATVTLDAAITNIGTVDMSGRTTAMTIANSSAPSIYGNLKAGSNVTFSTSNALNFSGRNTQTITSSGRTIGWDITVTSFGGTVELADALNMGTNTLFVLHGTFDTKNYNVTAGSLSSSNSNVRAITLGSSTVTLSGSTSPIGFSTATNLSFNCGTSTINSNNSGTQVITCGSILTFYNLTSTSAAAGSLQFNGTATSITFNSLTLTATSAAGLKVLILSHNLTINGTLTVDGATPVRRIFAYSNTLGTPRTLTVNSLSATDCDFRDITIAGAAAGSSPTRAGDCGGNTGITFPAAKTVYWNLAGAQNWSADGWATSSGGTPATNNFPLAQDTAVFDNTGSVTGAIQFNAGWNIGTFDSSLRTSAMTLDPSTAATTVYGDWKFGTGVTANSTTGSITFSGRGTQIITSNGVSFATPVTINSVTGTVQLADAFTLASNRTLTLTSGTFDAVTYNVTTGRFDASVAGATLKMGSGTWTLSGTGSVWAVTNSLINMYKGTANIVLSDTSTSARTFGAGGADYSYNKLTIGGATGTSTLTINGNNQFTELASTKTVAHTIALGTTTQTFGAWTVTGTAGNVVTLTGTGTSHVLAGACTSGIDYLAMGSIGFAATSPGEFYAGANSTGTAAAPVYRTAKPADSTRYWVGGTGNWSDTARWSTSSGGGSGASVPRSHDDVVFDAASNATAYTATVNAVTGGIRCKALTIAGPASGNVTLAGSTNINGIHGNVTLPATGLTRTYTGTIILSGSTTGRTLTTNGVVLTNNIVIDGVNCGWALSDALTNGTSSVLQITNGAFDTAGYSLTLGTIQSNFGNSRVFAFGASTITVNTSTPINFGTSETNRASLTVTAGTSQINVASSAVVFNGNNQTFYNISFTSTSTGTVTFNGANTFNNLSFTGITSAGLKELSITANQTINGTLTLSAGTNATMRTFVRSDTIGTTRTLTCANFVGTDVDFRDITIAGAAAPVSGTRLGDCKGNSGITFGAGVTRYWNLAGSNNWSATGWAATSGGSPAANNFPLAQDTAVFESTSPGTGTTTTINAAYNIGTIDMSARTSNTMTLATGSTTPAIYGNWINGTGTTLTGTGTLTFAGRGSQTITSAGKTFTQAFTVDTPSGSVALQDAFVCDRGAASTLLVRAGTFNANNYNFTLTASNSQVSAAATTTPRQLSIGSGVWTIAGSNGFSVDPTNLTVTGTGTISLTSASAKTFAGGGISYTGITLNQGGAGTLTITGNNTFANISNTYKATGATTIAMGTTTQRVGTFTASGEAGRVLTVTGSSASSPATLVFTGSGQATTPTTDYLTITGVRAYSLDTTWYAGANSTNNGSLGWYFEAGGGGPIAVFITESSTAADAQSSIATLYSAASETTTASDAAAAGLIYIGALSESATASDVVEAVRAYFAAIAEAVTSADLISASLTFAAAVAELTTASDSTAVSSRVTLPSIAEVAQAADALSGGLLFLSDISEVVNPSDTTAALLVINLAIFESLNANEATQVAASTFGAVAAETAQPLDTAQGANTGSSSLSESAVANDANFAAAVFEGRVNAFVQKTAPIEIGTSGLGSLMFDSASFSPNCAVVANGSGVGNSGGFASGGNYIEFKYDGSFPPQATLTTIPLTFMNVGQIRITYITGNNTNGGSDFGGVITVSLKTGAGVTIYSNSMPASSTYTTATLLGLPTFGSPLHLQISAPVNAGPTPTIGIKEIAFWGVGDSLAASSSQNASGVLNGRVEDAASVIDTASVAPSNFSAVALAVAQAIDSQNAPGSIYNAALPIQGAGAYDSLRRVKLRTVFIDDFVYTGADTTALTVDATVSGNTASGTVESGQITATVLP